MPIARTVIQPDALKDPRPRYSQGIRVEGGTLLFIAGQTAADRDGRVVGEGDIERQAEKVFENLAAVLHEAGATFDNLVMTTTYLTDLSYREAFGRVRLKHYGAQPPVNTLVVVKSLGAPEFLIEIDGIAVI